MSPRHVHNVSGRLDVIDELHNRGLVVFRRNQRHAKIVMRQRPNRRVHIADLSLIPQGPREQNDRLVKAILATHQPGEQK